MFRSVEAKAPGAIGEILSRTEEVDPRRAAIMHDVLAETKTYKEFEQSVVGAASALAKFWWADDDAA